MGGKCSGAQIAAHLKSKYHSEGLNFFAEGSFSNVERDFVPGLDPISRYVYGICLSAIRMQEDASVYGVNEVDFNIEKLWAPLLDKAKQGRIILIHAENDQRLPKEAFDAFSDLSKRVSAAVDSILFTSEDLEDAHADMCLKYADVKRHFAEKVFNAT